MDALEQPRQHDLLALGLPGRLAPGGGGVGEHLVGQVQHPERQLGRDRVRDGADVAEGGVDLVRPVDQGVDHLVGGLRRG